MVGLNKAALRRALAKVKEVVPDCNGTASTMIADVSKEVDIEAAVAPLADGVVSMSHSKS
jgi:hypothetical protein